MRLWNFYEISGTKPYANLYYPGNTKNMKLNVNPITVHIIRNSGKLEWINFTARNCNSCTSTDYRIVRIFLFCMHTIRVNSLNHPFRLAPDSSSMTTARSKKRMCTTSENCRASQMQSLKKAISGDWRCSSSISLKFCPVFSYNTKPICTHL